ncbi:MAG: SO_0444 family Cu/Zn efflux transporter [Pseudomonadales bacterium]
MDLLQNFIDLFVESAPWLLLGFVVAGLIKGLVPADFLSRHLGGRGAWTTVKAAFIGAPLPLCSCGVVPAALGLRKSGASKNATVSFLVATPETGVDSVTVTYALLGPVMAIVRPIAAIISGIVSGLLVGSTDNAPVVAESNSESSCCIAKVLPDGATSDSNTLHDGLRFVFIDMIRDISGWLVLGILFAAVIQTWVPASVLAQWGSGWLAFVVMVLIGIPMYICATASTPIAAGLLLAGVSPGAVLVFMMAGPATNIGTLAIVGQELGKRSLIAYLSGVILTSFAFGYMLNILASDFAVNFLTGVVANHEMGHSWWAYGSAVVLAAAILNVWAKQWFKPKQIDDQFRVSTSPPT